MTVMRVLVVKMSSLGDVVHTLPAVTDAARIMPDLSFDWVVEENFAEIPAWHPAVDKVIPVALRRWRRHPLKYWHSGVYRTFRKALSERHYDLIIDAQGLLKSAVVGKLATGSLAGLDKASAREPLAARFYDRAVRIPRDRHAVERVRALFAELLGYSVPPDWCDYGLGNASWASGEAAGRGKSLVFLHGTTWDTKKWPDRYWQELARIACAAGYEVHLLWGNAEERVRAESVARAGDLVKVHERLPLTAIARLLAASDAVVSVDTGLAHLAAALGVPGITVYGATDPGLTGTYGPRQHHLRSSLDCAPCLSRQCRYRGPAVTDNIQRSSFTVEPPCFADNPPERVWQRLNGLIGGGTLRP